MSEAIRNDFIPVIFGGDISCYILAREFHQGYGVKSIALTTAKGAVNQYTGIIDTIVDPELLNDKAFVGHVRNIKDKNPEKTLILQGCRDWQVRMIVRNKEELSHYAIVPYIDEVLLDKVVRKDDFYRICEELEIPYPKTLVLKPEVNWSIEEVDKSSIDYPLIAKASDSVEYYNVDFQGQKKVFEIESRDELEDLLKKVEGAGYKENFIIQDMIPGDDTNMRVLTCYAGRNSKVVFGALGHVLLEDQEENSRGNYVAIVNEPISEGSEVFKHAKKFLTSIGYTGFANFDIKYDERDGKYRFFEINTRLGASSLYVLAGGVNPTKYMVEELIDGKEFTDFETTTEKRLYTKVDKSNILSYLKNNELIDMVERMYEEKGVIEPLSYEGDKSILHKIYGKLFMNRQKKRFDEYLSNIKNEK